MDRTYRKSPRRNCQLLDHSGRALREIQPGGTEHPGPHRQDHRHEATKPGR